MKKILILDFGSQYTHLIKSVLLNNGFHSEIHPADISRDSIDNSKFSALILSGGASSVNANEINFDYGFLETGIPILGICYGHQLVANYYGVDIQKTTHEYGETTLLIDSAEDIIKGIDSTIVWMSHGDCVTELPKGAEVLAHTHTDPYSVLIYREKNIRTVQFHPEVSHTLKGESILINFAREIAGIQPSKKWSPATFIEDFKSEIESENFSNTKFLLGLSGGVDSMTLAAFMRRFLSRGRLICVYVESGLMQSETKQEVVDFCHNYSIELIVINAEERFFDVLKGVDDPREKGKVIGYEFIRIFDEVASKVGASVLLQGTIWSDVIESGVTKFSSQIKPHHNVACIPDDKKTAIMEPFRDLFKNQVRGIARHLKLPLNVVNKKVFPGPGFAIRVDGEVTKEKVEIVRKSNKIINEIIGNSDISNQIWMAFSILANARSLGVKGDKRVWNDYCIVVRIIESKNSMTANFSRLAMPLLPEISNKIISETDAGRVVYDITDKPPGTIEWQ
jgi:GMP synthase (glutamine-hydrolysing)